MAVFEKAKSLILTLESKRVTDDPDDRGGLTKYGISQRQYPDLDIANLSEADAYTLFEDDFWRKYRIGEIENQGIANQVFLLFIHMNPLHAAMIAQAAINACGRGIVTVKPDGVMGTLTIRALNSLADGWLSNRIRIETIHYYFQLTEHDKSQLKYFRGWVRRALA